MNPRVCIIRHRDYELQVRREAQALRDGGFSVDVICMAEPGHRMVEMDEGVRVVRIPVSRERGSRMRYVFDYMAFFVLSALTVTFLHARHRYAAIQANSMPDFLAFVAVLPKLFGAKVVAFMKEPTPEISAMKLGPGSLTKAITRIEQIVLRFVDHAFTVTDQLKETYADRGADPAKITVILNGHDPEHLPSGDAVPDPDHFTLFCHGTIEERYGHETLVRAAVIAHRSVPNLRLQITGRGTYLDEMLRLIADLDAAGFVQYLGYLPLAEMNERLLQSDVGVVPMSQSSYSDLVHTNKMYDFMATSKPVVATRLSSVAAYFPDDCVEFVTPDDPESMAAAFVRLAQDPQRRASLVSNASERYARYGWAAQRVLYVDAYRRLVGDPHAEASA